MMRSSWRARTIALCFWFSGGCVLPQVGSEDQQSSETLLCEDGAFSVPGSIDDPCSELSLTCDATLGRAVAQCESGAWKPCECLVPSADAATMAREQVTLPSAGSPPPAAEPSKMTDARKAGGGGIGASSPAGNAGSFGRDSLPTASNPTTPAAGSPTAGSASSAGSSGASGASGAWSAAAGSRGAAGRAGSSAAGRAGSSSTSWPAAGSSGVVALPRAGSSGASGSGAPPRRTSAGTLAAGYGGSW
jgi:hypothetical protein